MLAAEPDPLVEGMAGKRLELTAETRTYLAMASSPWTQMLPEPWFS